MMFWYKLFILVLAALDFWTSVSGTGCASDTGDQIPEEKSLLQCLLKDYDAAVRPVKDFKNTVDMSLNVILVSIEKLDEKEGILYTNGWMHQRWTDIQLTWDPQDYGGIDTLRIPINRIWQPDTAIFNNAAENMGFVAGELAIVKSNGQVDWAPHLRAATFCSLDMGRFPFDKQECSLIIGSWAYDTTKVNISLAKNDTLSKEVMYDGHEWDVNQIQHKRFEWTFDKVKYAIIAVKLDIERKPTFYRQMLVFPSVALAFLTLMLYYVPAETNERLSLGIGIMICIVLEFILVENYIPTELGEVPAVVVYLTYDLVMTSMTLLCSIITSNLYHRDMRKGAVPHCLRWMFLGRLSRWLCVPIGTLATGGGDSGFTSGGSGTSGPVPDHDEDFSILDRELTATADSALPRSPTMALEKTLDEIRRYLRALAAQGAAGGKQPEMMSHRDIVRTEWRHLAMVFDRLLFWVFLVLTVLISIFVYH